MYNGNLNLVPNLFKKLSHLLITSCHTLSPTFDRKLITVTLLNLVPRLLKSYHILPHFITPYHTLSPMFDGKLISVTTLNLVPSLFKKLSHLIMSYHTLSHLIPHA